MDNLKLYNEVREVPNEAKKEISAGRLKGKTDINPMWRIKILTEKFGVCGFGWKTKTVRKWIENGANNEQSAFVDIELYVKIDGEWSEAIEGSGGSSFVAKERNGMYTSDECFKMAFTDALSVACKMLGIGADVYWQADKTKYSKIEEEVKPEQEAEKCTREQYIKKIKLILWEVSGENELEARKLLEEYTSFVTKEGKQITGVTDTNKLSLQRLQATYGNIKRFYPEIAEKVKIKIKERKMEAV